MNKRTRPGVHRAERDFFRGGLSRLADVPDHPFVSGRGAYLIDSNGGEVLDLFASAGVISLGHCDAGFATEVQNLAQGLFSCPSPSESRVVFWKALSPHLPKEFDRAYFFSGGAEANEAAIRIAQAATGRHAGIYLTNAYHGRTQATAAISGNGRAPHIPLRFGDDVSSTIIHAERACSKAAYLIAEPIQATAGNIPPLIC